MHGFDLINRTDKPSNHLYRAILLAIGLLLSHDPLRAQLLPDLDPPTQAYRPDRSWLIGYGQTTYDPANFGITTITFANDGPRVRPILDSLSAFRYGWNNATYALPGGHTLSANGWTLVRDLADTIADHTAFWGTFFVGNTSPTAHQHILPLGGDTLAWVSEVTLDAPFPRGYAPRGFAVSYLDGARLARGDRPARSTALGPPRYYELADTLLRETFDHVADPRGGWWGIARSAESDRFQRWRVTRDSLQVLAPARAGPTQTDRSQFGTRLKFRPQGDAFAIVGADSTLGLYRFDRHTGDIALWAHVPVVFPEPWWEPFRLRHDAEWSACGRYLYIAYHGAITRVDTEGDLGDPAAWQSVTEQRAGPYIVSYFELERGPDCRIYVGPVGASQYMSVIDDPSAGASEVAGTLQPDGMAVGRWYFVSLPDAPDYGQWARDRLRRGLPTAIDTATCDPRLPAYPYVPYRGLVSVEESGSPTPAAAGAGLRVWPNPARAGASVRVGFGLGVGGATAARDASAGGAGATVWLVDGAGRARALGPWGGEASAVALPSGLAGGAYALELRAAGRRWSTMVVVVGD